MKICPKCGGKKFIVSAQIIEDWVVDENGSYVETVCSGEKIMHLPDDDDIWECKKCQYSDKGKYFEVKSFDVTITYSTSKTFHVEAYDAEDAIDVASEQLDSEESPISYVVVDENGVIEDGMF